MRLFFDWIVSFSAASLAAATLAITPSANAQTLSNGTFNVRTGTNGEITSLKLVGDSFPTEYVLNASNAPGQNTADHEWMGELMLSYRVGSGSWQTALTQASSDGRKISQSGGAVTVTYQNSANAQGVKTFKLVETYSLVGDYFYWQIALTNTSSQTIEFGDLGLPLPFNEYWFANNDVIYETRTVYHSFTGQNSSYIVAQRPSGVGPFLLMVPDAATGAGFEYMDAWVDKEHPGSAWAAGGGKPAWPNGLDVFYVHSNAIKKTNRGYLPNTSLTLAANESKTYAFKFFKVASRDEVKSRLYSEGLIDVSVLPSMILATNMTAKIDLHTSKTVNSLTPQFPDKTTIGELAPVATDHKLYKVHFAQLGPNDITVGYGSGELTTLQFYVLEPIDAAIQRHATFIVQKTQWPSGDMKNIFDDWTMDSSARRGATGGWGWGDDWGWTHGEFLAEKNAQAPVAAEVSALDNYLDAVWARAINNTSYVVQDWWCPAGTTAAQVNDCFYDRAYTYPHAFNTYFSMYKIASRYPDLAAYHSSADAYLLRAYGILNTLYSGHGDPGTGYMGLQTLPEIADALSAAGHSAEARKVTSILTTLYKAFQGSAYPYGSEYSYDNTGEEGVYTAAKVAGDQAVLSKVNAKTRACRGQEPVWYYYADPVTLNGENYWQFQYTAALAGYCMDDWTRGYSTTPEMDERLTYAAKIANISAINSGQIDSTAENIGSVAWTYQAAKGTGINYATTQTLHNGWWQMAGEADLGLFGAIRILSADVAVDPIFGLFGYGCDVSSAGGCYSITPTDGVFKRLNLITEKFHMELERDQYSAATVSTAKTYVGFSLVNLTPTSAHTTKLSVSGVSPGTYDVSMDGARVASMTVAGGTPTVVGLPVGTKAGYQVTIGTGCTGAGNGAADGGSGLGENNDGAAGSRGTDGAAGSGGPGSGDASAGGNNGGSVANVDGSAPGSAATDPAAGNESGCGCRIPGERLRPNAWDSLGMMGLAALRLRRKPSGQCRLTRHGSHPKELR